MSVERVARAALARVRASGTHREMRVLDGNQAARMRVGGAEKLIFAGSNYLDLASHPEVVEASARAARDLGCAAGGSRLINGNLRLHEELEERLAAFIGCEAALVFSTGYMANLGVIPALVGAGDLLVSDALNHASIVDGARLSKARVRVFAHGDAEALDEVLREERGRAREILIAVDGVYSMDGDVAPLTAIRQTALRHDALWLVDDAHGTGTLGASGRGSLEHVGLVGDGLADCVLGTLGKSLGAFGAFVGGTRLLRELLVNTARSFIFSCALAPPQAAAALAALSIVEREPWRRWVLQARAAQLRARLAAVGISTAPSTTHIVPVVIGDNQAAMRLCEDLLARGFYAQGIRHPSVPVGTARLRITLMASHTEEDVDRLADALIALLAPLDLPRAVASPTRAPSDAANSTPRTPSAGTLRSRALG